MLQPKHSYSGPESFVTAITNAEADLLDSLQVSKRLYESLMADGGLRRFASAFYFIRVHFVKLNFIVGSRCPTHELYWAGLAHNLMEELGGESGTPHNELYRWFLKEAGVPNENSLECPPFATRFNHVWEEFARDAPLEETLGAIAVYEIFDNPDYQMLLNVMSRAQVSARGLVFFRVHAEAAHFDLFEDYFRHISNQQGGIACLEKAKDFVLRTQKEMWAHLLEHLTEN